MHALTDCLALVSFSHLLCLVQSYGVDEAFINEDLGRLLSPKRTRSVKRADSAFQRQASFRRQGSSTAAEGKEVTKRQVSSKDDDEEADKDIPEVSILRVLKYNAKEWYLILLGTIGSAINGSINPLFAVLFGQIFDAFQTSQRSEVINAIHPWAATFIAFGVVSGLAVFFKVSRDSVKYCTPHLYHHHRPCFHKYKYMYC